MTVLPIPISLSSECVVEAEGRTVADGESWRDPSNACVTCTCRVSWGREGGGWRTLQTDKGKGLRTLDQGIWGLGGN